MLLIRGIQSVQATHVCMLSRFAFCLIILDTGVWENADVLKEFL